MEGGTRGQPVSQYSIHPMRGELKKNKGKEREVSRREGKIGPHSSLILKKGGRPVPYVRRWQYMEILT